MSSSNSPEAIRAQYKALAKLSKAQLQARVKRSRRVSDLRGCSKDELVTMALTDEHGARRVVEAFLPTPRGFVVGDKVCCHGGEGNSEKIGGEFEVLAVSGVAPLQELQVRCIHSGYETQFYSCDVYRI